MKSFRHIALKGSFFLLGLGFDCQIHGATPEEIIAGTGTRIDQVFQAESGDPYTVVKVRAPLASGRPYYARAYSWSVVGYAARCFYLNESLPEANARLQQNARYYLRELTTADIAEILPTAAESNTSAYSRIVDRDSFHWHADMILRLIEMYGINGTVAPGRMDAATQAKCLEPIWHYTRLVSRLTQAEFQNSKTWHLWQSENHHVQSFSVAWHFSKIAKDMPLYQNQTYNDGSTPGQLYAAWNSYFVEYVRERFRKGIFVEMMSQGYNGESIRGIYNFYDFGDAEVRKHAGMYLDLFWAYWAQEQFNDVVGGSNARLALRNALNPAHNEITSNMANLYFGLGVVPVVNGHSVNAVFSSYRPKTVIADIAVDVAGRGTYEVRQTAQGLGQAATTTWDMSVNMVPYKQNTDGGGIVRYSYCTPSFIMGSPQYKARPLADWTAISSQGRQQGVIFSGAAEAARILPCVLPSDQTYARNAFWSVQSKGSMITQMLTTNQDALQMWAWISKAGLTDPVAENGILFVETDEANGAYAAIRPVGTNYTLIENYNFTAFTAPDHWIVQLNDKFKPMILEVMAKDQVADFAAFKALVKANTPTLASGLVTHTTIYGDVLTLDTNYIQTPTVNGANVNFNPSKSYDSPFLYGNYNGGNFTIEKGSRKETYQLPVPPVPPISVLRSGSHIDGAIDAIAGGKTITIDAGAADFLIVGTSTEFGAGSTFTATFAGNPMTLATGNGGQSNLFYLDLTKTAYSGGNANLTFSWNYTSGGDLAVGWVSVDGNLQAGQSIVLHKTASADSSTNTVSLVTSVDAAFNFVSFNGNLGNDASTTQAPLTKIYSDGSFGSNAGAAGYETDVNPGINNYSWNHNVLRRIDAAAFVVAGDFSVWVASYPGLAGMTGLADDPDGDGIPNAIEAVFGTHPGEFSRGFSNLATDATTTTFTHPLSGNPPTDLTLSYIWSDNLIDWYDGDGIDGPAGGNRVSISSQADGTAANVTATANQPMDRLFVRPVVLQDQ